MKFSKVQKTYNENAIVQFEMAKKLASLIQNFCNSPAKLLEIGSGTGFLTKHLLEMPNNNNPEFFLNDINDNQTGFDLPAKSYIQGDILKIEIPEHFDLISSNAVFQWIDNLDILFSKLHAGLNDGGILAFSTFGIQNYKQFKNNGTPKYLKLQDIEAMLIQNSFEVSYFEEEIFTLYFNSPREVLNHIKTTGVSTFGISEGKGLWGKSTLKDFENHYSNNNSDDNGIELTYHPIYFIAKK